MNSGERRANNSTDQRRTEASAAPPRNQSSSRMHARLFRTCARLVQVGQPDSHHRGSPGGGARAYTPTARKPPRTPRSLSNDASLVPSRSSGDRARLRFLPTASRGHTRALALAATRSS
eukprot:1878140-Pleurochrysis_carterae.AAC.3